MIPLGIELHPQKVRVVTRKQKVRLAVRQQETRFVVFPEIYAVHGKKCEYFRSAARFQDRSLNF